MHGSYNSSCGDTAGTPRRAWIASSGLRLQDQLPHVVSAYRTTVVVVVAVACARASECFVVMLHLLVRTFRWAHEVRALRPRQVINCHVMWMVVFPPKKYSHKVQVKHPESVAAVVIVHHNVCPTIGHGSDTIIQPSWCRVLGASQEGDPPGALRYGLGIT